MIHKFLFYTTHTIISTMKTPMTSLGFWKTCQKLTTIKWISTSMKWRKMKQTY